jgi:hypothetical protein
MLVVRTVRMITKSHCDCWEKEQKYLEKIPANINLGISL